MPRDQDPRRWNAGLGQGLPLGSGDGGQRQGAGRGNTVAPGYREHPRRSDLGRAERGNPVEVRASPGKPTVRKDQLLRRERMVKKRMPAGRKATGNRGTRAASFSSRLA